jgi:uncharacterized Zn finger protein
MRKESCPQCLEIAGQPIKSLNAFAHVTYWRCAKCGHVWVTTKHEPDESHAVTVRTDGT